MRKKKTEEPMQKTVKQILEEIMKSDVKNADILAKLQDCGMEKADINMKTVLVYDLYELARKGNSKAVDTVLGLLGEGADDGNTETVITVNLVDGEPKATKTSK
jgi:hypothetical protein